eukprot:scaffold99777_cov56-Phaeocystis_antarctica.AAC.2
MNGYHTLHYLSVFPIYLSCEAALGRVSKKPSTVVASPKGGGSGGLTPPQRKTKGGAALRCGAARVAAPHEHAAADALERRLVHADLATARLHLRTERLQLLVEGGGRQHARPPRLLEAPRALVVSTQYSYLVEAEELGPAAEDVGAHEVLVRVQVEGEHRAVVAVFDGVPQCRGRIARHDECEVERARRREHAESHVEGRAPHLRREEAGPRGLAVLEARFVPELGGHDHPACAHLDQLEVNVRRIGEQLTVARRVAPVQARRAAAAGIALAAMAVVGPLRVVVKAPAEAVEEWVASPPH